MGDKSARRKLPAAVYLALAVVLMAVVAQWWGWSRVTEIRSAADEAVAAGAGREERDERAARAAEGAAREAMRSAAGTAGRLAASTEELFGWMRQHAAMAHGVEKKAEEEGEKKKENNATTTTTEGRGEEEEIAICIPISITTRRTKWTRIDQMLLLSSFFPSLVATAERGFRFGVYLGYDEGDPLLDSKKGQEELRAAVEKLTGGFNIEMRTFKYADSRNKNVWAVNYITRECYLDGYDYFYRVNDDSSFKGLWARVLTQRIRETKDFGVVGVLDHVNPRIFTHSLVGRPHIEVFGYHFPFEFGNYWSDDWITFVYEEPFVHKAYDVLVEHKAHAERYKVEYERKGLLDTMVDLGKKRWKAYLCLVRKMKDYCLPDAAEFATVWT